MRIVNLLVEHKEAVIWITLNRPKHHDAINGEMMDALEKVIQNIR